MAQASASIVTELHELLRDKFSIAKLSDEPSLVCINAGGQNNILFRATFDDTGDALALKICIDLRTNARNATSAEREFQQLTQLYNHAHQGAFRVIEPVCAFPEKGLLVTKWVNGPRLSNHLRSLATPLNECYRLCEKAGRWLNAFHSFEHSDDKLLDANGTLDKLAQTLSVHSNNGALQGISIKAISLLEKTAQIVVGTPISQRFIHGDFHAGNLINDNDELVGLDIGNCRLDNNLNDLVSWMNHITHMTLMPRGLARRVHLEQLNLAFLKGYQSGGASCPRVDEKALHWLRTVSAVSFLERHRKTGRTMFHNAYFRFVASQNLKRLSKKLHEWIR